MAKEELMTEESQMVVFKLAQETYGVDINYVREIITLQSITEVPGTIEIIEGIINLRGYVIPIFNLRKKFCLPEEELTKEARIVVVEVSGNTLGMIVDGVSEVLRISGKDIEEPSRLITSNIDTDFIKGIANLEEQLVTILNLDNILNKEEKIAMEMMA